ncbi:predicted protein [Nematostella vectensis]|uniref:Uncharacterized protein n=1 Tax=Nematostella vectensis TaxID=45351 RepID=A7RHR5_NEMVE|nr:predicted protein [Nematostella vectensis]|eukprot:XP_001640963.1 predicted protein [Nematostella vectensis]
MQGPRRTHCRNSNIDPKSKPKKYWSYIKIKKTKTADKVGIPPLRGKTRLKVDSLSKAETLNA